MTSPNTLGVPDARYGDKTRLESFMSEMVGTRCRERVTKPRLYSQAKNEKGIIGGICGADNFNVYIKSETYADLMVPRRGLEPPRPYRH